MCDRFHKLPSEIYAEDAGLFRLLEIERRGKPPQPEGGEQGWPT